MVAIDVPSGLCSDSGRFIGDQYVVAGLTVTFHRAKIGHYTADGPAASGRTRVVDLGLERVEPEAVNPIGEGVPNLLLTGKVPRDVSTRQTPPIVDTPDRTLLVGHLGEEFGKSELWGPRYKYTYGHVLILSGGVGRGGAARMAARGALRIGAGLVTVGCPPAALIENASRLDAVMLRSLKDGAALAVMLQDPRINALGLGPGLGTDARAEGLVRMALRAAVGVGEARHRRLAVVLDADALTLLSRNADLFAMLHDRCVLTPHSGEFKRLFPNFAERLGKTPAIGPAYSKVDATREAAARAGCVVLCKGPDTVIADPQGRASISSAAYERSAPWLATAGSGDVLTGFVAGLLARGFDPMRAAEAAAWLHVECALEFGPGLIAEDLPEQLPAVFRRLGL